MRANFFLLGSLKEKFPWLTLCNLTLRILEFTSHQIYHGTWKQGKQRAPIYRSSKGPQEPWIVLEMNELPVIRSLCYAQRVLGSPRGKQRKLLQRNIWRKVVFCVQKNYFWENSALFCSRFNRKGWKQCWYVKSVSFCLDNHEVCVRIFR